MKLIAIGVVLVFALSASAAAAQRAPSKADPNGLIDHPAPPKAEASGAWQVEGRITSHGSTIAATRPVCALQQQNGVLTGGCKGPNSQGAVQGIVFGRHVRWTWRAVPFTQKTPPGVTTFDGELGADGRIEGMWTYSGLPGLTGRFTATRPRPAAP